jgi:hypothetical protein
MARPSVWRCEFQQVENEYIPSSEKQKPGADANAATPGQRVAIKDY